MRTRKQARIITRRDTLTFLGAIGASTAVAGLFGCGDGGDASTPSGGSSGSSGDGSSGASPGGGSSAGPGSDGGSGAFDAEAGAKLDAGGPQSGFIGSYANLNLQAHAIYSIDMALMDYPQWTFAPDSGETRVHEVGTWWDGGDALRMHPPTVSERGSGIGAITNLWRNATFAIRELNFRFEWQAGPEYCSRSQLTPKFVIAHSSPALDIGSPVRNRPMLYLPQVNEADNATLNRANTLTIVPAQGTVRSFSLDPYSENGTYYGNQVQPFYFANTDGTFNGRPVIGANQVITFEMRMLAIGTAAHPRGLIAVRTYLRNGAVYERGCPWDWDAAATLNTSYLNEIQMFGGGYFNVGNPAHPNNYTRVGGLITLAANHGGWLGPRPGFVV
ncbi:MAG: hypothetical protein KF819_26695 [Labilithrix sp.]|nr:hypothetical protein [Labilithrix sp.]